MPIRPQKMFPFGLIASTPFWERAAWYRNHYTKPAADDPRVIAVGDQMQAATEGADDITAYINALVSDRQPDEDWRLADTYDLSEEARIGMYGLVMAAADWSKQCPHMGSPAPSLALLRVGIIACEICAAAAYDGYELGMIPDATADDECDLCREHESTNMFYPTVFQTGPMVIIGDICGRCFGQLPTDELNKRETT